MCTTTRDLSIALSFTTARVMPSRDSHILKNRNLSMADFLVNLDDYDRCKRVVAVCNR